MARRTGDHLSAAATATSRRAVLRCRRSTLSRLHRLAHHLRHDGTEPDPRAQSDPGTGKPCATFTTTRHFAQFYANLLPLAIVPSPIAFPPMRFYQLWHERNHHSAGHRWLRRLLSDCGRRIVPPPAERIFSGRSAPASPGCRPSS